MKNVGTCFLQAPRSKKLRNCRYINCADCAAWIFECKEKYAAVPRYGGQASKMCRLIIYRSLVSATFFTERERPTEIVMHKRRTVFSRV